ncbi:hypothetical protein SAMN04487860_12019 [Ruminococcus flavefaciens]|uniref:Uncharacterized protein n=2 Tax=Ruminococcus flavefaciens TaxID=1265 RepID=A0A1M7M9P6_RUMFL|nr:hypothetical protein SAMN04487860_12019 [Ruminococcus flavefaciens]
MTVEKRNHIFEIIFGLLLIIIPIKEVYDILSVYSHGISILARFQYLKYLITPILCFFFPIVCGFMIIFRKYDSLCMKILFAATGFGAVLNSTGGFIFRGYFGISLYSIFTYFSSTTEKFMFISLTIAMAAGIVIALMTMNRKIVWKSRHQLLTYTFLLIFVCIISGILSGRFEINPIIIFILPCLIHSCSEKSDMRGIIGNIALLATVALPEISRSLERKRIDLKYSAYHKDADFLKALTDIEKNYAMFSEVIKWLLLVMILLIPLIIFEKKIGNETEESEQSSSTVMLSESDEETDDEDEYDEDEYDEEDFDDDEDEEEK